MLVFRSKDYSSIVGLDDFDLLRSLNGPILITGHTGFKGTWLTFLCKELGIDVYGLSLPAEKGSMYDRLQLLDKNPEIFCDIRDREEVLKSIKEIEPAAIIHLAAQPLVLESYNFPVETFHTNVMGTAHILDAATKINSVKIVGVATTDKVYLNENLGFPFKENSPMGGKDPYSASKVGTEQALSAWQQISSANNGPRIVAMRAGNVIGGGDFAADRLLPDLIRAGLFNQPTTIRNPKSTRPWQHVLDPLYGYLLYLEASLRGCKTSALNFAPKEKSLSVEQVVGIFRDKFPKMEVEVLPSYDPEKESQLLNLDSSLASKEVNWHPRLNQVSAINQTIAWWVTNQDDPISHASTILEINDYLK